MVMFVYRHPGENQETAKEKEIRERERYPGEARAQGQSYLDTTVLQREPFSRQNHEGILVPLLLSILQRYQRSQNAHGAAN